MTAAIYAHDSSDNQREESIESQIRECTAYAEKNSIDDRCQRQKQGGAVGAAAVGNRDPGSFFILRGSRRSPGQTLFHSPLKNGQTKTTVRVDGGSVIEKNRREAGRVSGQAPAGSWQNPPA